MEDKWKVLRKLPCFENLISFVFPWTLLHCVHYIDSDLKVYVFPNCWHKGVYSLFNLLRSKQFLCPQTTQVIKSFCVLMVWPSDYLVSALGHVNKFLIFRRFMFVIAININYIDACKFLLCGLRLYPLN